MDTKFAGVLSKNVDKLRTYFKAIVEEMTKTNSALMTDLKKSWKGCCDSLKSIEDKELKRAVTLDNSN